MENKKYTVMVEGKSSPQKIHENYELAEIEAKRLAIQERKIVYILLAISKVELVDVKVTSLA